MTTFHLRVTVCVTISTCLLAGCVVGPKYHRASVDTPAAYKELTPPDFQNTEGWKVAQPKDETLRGKWWEIFDDPSVECAGRESECIKPKHRIGRGELSGGTGNGQGGSIPAVPYGYDQSGHHCATPVWHDIQRRLQFGVRNRDRHHVFVAGDIHQLHAAF